MFTDSQTTLYIVLAISIALLTVFLCVTLIYLILILRDASKMIEKVRDTVEKINAFVIKPVTLAASIVDHIRPLIEGAMERKHERDAKRKGK
jgi:uncharacterized protein YoxC